MRLSFEIAGSQIDGARDYQEDAFLITHLGDSRNPNSGSLVIVADGMGGHAAGNVAANMAVQNFNQHVTRNYPSAKLPEVLKESVNQANQAISATVREANVLKGMGCTLIGALFDRAGLHYASVGDSHLLLIRGDEISKTNADHSYGGYLDRMAASGQPVAADPTLTRNMLLSALTGESIMEVDCPESPVELRPGDRILICTDGMDSLDHSEILQISKSAITAKSCVDKLLNGVKLKNVPRQDNTTVVTIDVRGEQEKSSASANRAPTTAEIPVEKNGRTGSWLLALGALLALGGGAYWYLQPDLGLLLRESADVQTTPTPTSTRRPTERPASVEEAAPSLPPTVNERPASVNVPGFRDSLRGGGQGPELVWIEAGAFNMGSSKPGAESDEQPGHPVKVPRFAIMRYEVTLAEYERFKPANVTLGANQRRDQLPVAGISWNDAKGYARWLSDQTGRNYRLPSESEWEYAASAGTSTPFWWGYRPEDNRAFCHACAPGLSPNKPGPIGQFPNNAFGLFDTAGNIAEWVQDCYFPSHEGAPTDNSPREMEHCTQRVVRGGAFSSPPRSLRNTKRARYNPERGYDEVGMRLVREP